MTPLQTIRNLLILEAGVVALVVWSCCGGCANESGSYQSDADAPITYHKVKEFLLITGPENKIKRMIPQTARREGDDTIGYCDENLRILYVPTGWWSVDGKPLPNRFIIGDETLHLIYGRTHQ